jgi:type I restriction enzyme, S subunit
MSSEKQLPSGWCEAGLSEVAQINPPNPTELPADDALVSFVPMASVEALRDHLDASEVRPWHEVRKGYTRFQDGDVLFAKITPCMENGKAAVARGLTNGLGAGSTEFHVLRPGEALRAQLLLQYVLREDFRKSARAQMTGTAGQLRVPTRFLEEQRVPIPPRAEQDRIIEAIESYFTRLDDAVTTLERVQRNLRRYHTSVLKAAVEGRLVQPEAELARAEGRSYEPASVLLTRILAERRRRWEAAETAKMKVKGLLPKNNKWKARCYEPVAPITTELPQLPEGWCWATVDQLAEDVPGSICAGPFGTIFKARDFRPSGIPIIFLRHVKPDAYLTTKPTFMDQGRWEELFRDYSVYGGELLVTKLGYPPGDCAVFPEGSGPAMLTPDVMKLQVDQQLADRRFVMHYMNSILARQFVFGTAFGTTRLRLTLPLFRATPVPLPPRPEQGRIVEEVDRVHSIEGAVSDVAYKNSNSVARLRQAVVRWAFEGRLVAQDPTDEPASVLLERILAERQLSNGKPPRIFRRRKARADSA